MTDDELVPKSPKAQLLGRSLSPKYHFGQNFLSDHSMAARIAELCAPSQATVVELGAGLGALTRPLLARSARVIAVERDRDLVPVLREDLSDAVSSGALTVIEADAKAIDPSALLAGTPGLHVLCGNLPYQITGPLLEMCVRHAAALDRAVFLVQFEVAQRLAGVPGTKQYGALSVFTQAAFAVSRPLVVRRGAFYPQPNVDSAVILLLPRAQRIAETPTFAALVHGAFEKRRKQLRNAWRGLPQLEDAAVERAAHAAGIDLERRGETLSVEDFARVAALLEGATT